MSPEPPGDAPAAGTPASDRDPSQPGKTPWPTELRVNRAENEWLFNEQWGVDVSVSKPRLMAAVVEEAVSVGDLVRLMTFRQAEANLVEITLPPAAPYVGHPVRDVPLPHDSALVAVLRGKRVLVPTPDDPLEAGDELVFICTTEVEETVRTVILGSREDG